MQAMTINSSGGHRYRGRAGLAGEVGVAGEALGAGGTADQRRGRLHAATLLGEQRRPVRLDEPNQLSLQLVGLARQRADLCDLFARHARAWLICEASQPPRYPLQRHVASELVAAQLCLELRAQLEQMPAQPVYRPRALGDELIAVV